MLKQRAAGDKSWRIACSDTTLGTADEKLDLSGAHLSDGNFKGATFIGAGAIKLNGASLAHADLRGAKFTTDGGFGNGLIALKDLRDYRYFTGVNFSDAYLRDYGEDTIDSTEDILDASTIIAPPPLSRSAPPCTVEMLKKRPAGDKSWPIACGHTTLGQYFKNFTL